MKTVLSRLSVLIIAFLFFNCSSDSGDTPCVPITCLNGGTSTPECGCNCPQGYSGSDCSTQITPTKITITKIRVKKFPNLNTNINYWDTFVLPGYERPDIFPVLLQASAALYAGTTINDSFSYGNDTFDFIPTTPIEITQISQQFTLRLYDDDSTTLNPNSFEQMGGFTFYIYNSTGGFPTTMPLNSPTSYYGFELTLSYTW